MNLHEAIEHLDRVIPDRGDPATGDAFEAIRRVECYLQRGAELHGPTCVCGYCLAFDPQRLSRA